MCAPRSSSSAVLPAWKVHGCSAARRIYFDRSVVLAMDDFFHFIRRAIRN